MRLFRYDSREGRVVYVLRRSNRAHLLYTAMSFNILGVVAVAIGVVIVIVAAVVVVMLNNITKHVGYTLVYR